MLAKRRLDLGAGVVAVRDREVLGLAVGDETGVGAAVVAHHHGSVAKVDDFDDVRVAVVREAAVLVVTPVGRGDRAVRYVIECGVPLVCLHDLAVRRFVRAR